MQLEGCFDDWMIGIPGLFLGYNLGNIQYCYGTQEDGGQIAKQSVTCDSSLHARSDDLNESRYDETYTN